MPRQATSGKRLSVWTALPATPLDGQEILYRFVPTQTPASTIPLLWHLRYDAAYGAWLPVGDQRPIFAFYQPGASVSIGAGSWGTYDANDPQLRVPLAGTYELETGAAEAYFSSGAAYASTDKMALTLNKNGVQIDVQYETSASTLSGTGQMSLKGSYALAANDLLRQAYFLSAGGTQNIVARGRYAMARPQRIG